jgi:hypothetical protein
MFISTVAALSTIYPDARNVLDPEARKLQIYRLIGKVPTIAAYCYRHSLGFPYVYPDNDLSYTENFMNMLWKMTELKYEANSALARALDILFILHRELHEHALENDRAEVRSELGLGSRARHFVYPARRSRAELQYECDALRRQLSGGPVRCHRRRGCRAFRSTAWRRQRRGA